MQQTRSSGTSVLIIILIIVTFPLWIGLIGGLFGLIFGLFGAAFGIVGAVFGIVFGAIGSVFGFIFDTGSSWSFGDYHFWNGKLVSILLVVLVILVVTRSRRI